MCKKLSLLLFTLHSRIIDKIIYMEILHVQINVITIIELSSIMSIKMKCLKIYTF